ncbi:MAG: LamG domain-containing protein [Verrucomicrobia bacterium]|nr:LamG domain-containing protein [Verrucomicrobiota bacterium]
MMRSLATLFPARVFPKHAWDSRFAMAGLVSLLILVFPRAATAPSLNHVLRLDGRNSYVELPVQTLAGLTEATLECWVRLDDTGSRRRIFNFGKPRRDLSLMMRGEDSVGFVIADSTKTLHWVDVPGVFAKGRWIHVAATCGPSGMRVYINGLPYDHGNSFNGSFASVAADGRCYLGKTVTGEERDPTLAGAIDNFRVWSRVRSPREVQQTMFEAPPASTEGLVLSLDFEPGEGPESASLPGGAKLVGNATLEAQQLVPGRRSPGNDAHVVPEAARQTHGGFLAGLLTAFCLLHSLLVAFQKSARAHFYFALISGLAAINSWPAPEIEALGRAWLAVQMVLVGELFRTLFGLDVSWERRGLMTAAVISGALLTLDKLGFGLPGFLSGLVSLVAGLTTLFAALHVLRLSSAADKAKAEGARIINAGLGALIAFSLISFEVPFFWRNASFAPRRRRLLRRHLGPPRSIFRTLRPARRTTGRPAGHVQ